MASRSWTLGLGLVVAAGCVLPTFKTDEELRPLAQFVSSCDGKLQRCTADQTGYSRCLVDACDSEMQQCYGPGYKQADFSGPCGQLWGCMLECPCGVTLESCTTACNAKYPPSQECATCFNALRDCKQASGCSDPCKPGEGDSGAAGTGAGGSCPDANMARLPAGFCIDKREVTQRDYAAWLGRGRHDEPGIECAWNVVLAPSCQFDAATGTPENPDNPVVCVDWCDAQAYCREQGKRLCGARKQGKLAFAEAELHPDRSEWSYACSSDETYVYPYGNTYKPGACNTASGAAVDQAPSCHSPYDGFGAVLDLSGNAWEWEDSCEALTGGTERCRLRGGSFAEVQDLGREQYECTYPYAANRITRANDLGFRCCWSP
jgi:hypothetical protein